MPTSLIEIKLQLSSKDEILFGQYAGENIILKYQVIKMPYFSGIDVKFQSFKFSLSRIWS